MGDIISVNDELAQRYDSAIEKLAAGTPATKLQTDIALISVMRLGSLALTNEDKVYADAAYEDVGTVLSRIKEQLDSHKQDGEPSNELSNLAVYELIALNDQAPLGQSVGIYEDIKTILHDADEHAGTLGLLSLSRHRDLFDIQTTSKMPSFISFIKGEESEVSDSTLIDIAIIANSSLDAAKLKHDSGLIRGSFINMANHKVFEELQYRADNKIGLTSLMFKQFGSSFSSNLYRLALETNNDDAAMDLLNNSRYGLLVKESEKSASNNRAEVKELLGVIVSGEKSDDNIGKIIESADSLDFVFESLVDVHNNHYNSQNLANFIDKAGARMSFKQLEKLGAILSENHQTQPVLPALQKIIDTCKDKGYDSERISKSYDFIHNNLRDEFSQLSNSFSSYSGTTIDFMDSKNSISVRDAKTVPHLQFMMNEVINSYGDSGDFEVNGFDSLVDDTVKEALLLYMRDGDSKPLNDLMSNTIRAVEKDRAVVAQLLFEANAQNKLLPALAVSDAQFLADIADHDSALHSDGHRLIGIDNLHSINDLPRKIFSVDPNHISMDATGLGEDYDKMFLSTLKDYIKDPDSNQKQTEMNEIIGLPVVEVSSKITTQQEVVKSEDSFIKKAADSFISATRSPK